MRVINSVDLYESYSDELLDEGLRSRLKSLFGRKEKAPSRGEQLRVKHGKDIRGKRYERTQQLYGRNSSQAQRVSQAGASLRDIRSRDTASTHEWRGEGNAATRKAGRIPQPQTIGSRERASQFKGKSGQKSMNIPPSGPVFVRRDIQDMPLASQRAARGRKKPLATGNSQINAEFELWVNELINEGYDLSEHTWDEMYELYESYDNYLLVLEYLLDEGYADDVDTAEEMVGYMSEEWLESIMETKNY